MTYMVLFLVLLVLLFGRRIEHTLEKISWVMISFVFLFLVMINAFFIPGSVWLETGKGFVGKGNFSPDMDWTVLAAVAAYA
ncbi:MAG: hypothetical protein GWN58_16070, partial [Anaerolineae bacterium]|nr:hypothetical protein [Anaerolineae bacterium]